MVRTGRIPDRTDRMVLSKVMSEAAKPANQKPATAQDPEQKRYLEDFRQAGHESVEWIARYLGNVGDLPVMAQVKPGELLDSLPASAPEKGESFAQILADFDRLIMPAVTQWNHPRFFAYFACTGSTPAVLGEMLAAAALSMTPLPPPACTPLSPRANWWRPRRAATAIHRDW